MSRIEESEKPVSNQVQGSNTNNNTAVAEVSQTQPPQQVSQTASGSSKTQSNSSGNNIVGVHYKIGRKIGEGSLGIIYEGIFD
jgi:hypothetical protein